MPRLQTETINPPAQFEKTATVPGKAPAAAPAATHATATTHAPVTARPAADGALVVPVKLPKGATQEIVLRIVLQVEE